MDGDYYTQPASGLQDQSVFPPHLDTDLHGYGHAAAGETTADVSLPVATPKVCSVRGCTHMVEPESKAKMCADCRAKHRIYATTKRRRRKAEKQQVATQIGQQQPQHQSHSPPQSAPSPPPPGPSASWDTAQIVDLLFASNRAEQRQLLAVEPPQPVPVDSLQSEQQQQLIMGNEGIPWSHLIDPALFHNQNQNQNHGISPSVTAATTSTSSELMYALQQPAPIPVLAPILAPPPPPPPASPAVMPPPAAPPVVHKSMMAMAAAPVAGPSSAIPRIEGSAAADNQLMDVNERASIGPQPSSEPRPCSVKGCRLTVPAGSFFKMCEPCRDRYRIYGNTKRAKWKRDRDTVTLELQTRKEQEDKHRVAAGLLPLSEAPIEEWRAWESSVVDEALKRPEDPSTPALPVRMCTVSHCRKVLPGWYKFRRCEQHRLQNRYHGQLKRAKELKAISDGAGSGVPDDNSGEGYSSGPKKEEEEEESGDDDMETSMSVEPVDLTKVGLSPAERGFKRQNHHCSTKGCNNMLAPTVPWKMCDACRERDRLARRIQRAKDCGVIFEGTSPRIPGPNGEEEGDDGEDDDDEEEESDDELDGECPQGPNTESQASGSAPPSGNVASSQLMASLGPLVVPPMKPRRSRRPNRTQAEKELMLMEKEKRMAAKRIDQEERRQAKEAAKIAAKGAAAVLKAEKDAQKAAEKEEKASKAAALKEEQKLKKAADAALARPVDRASASVAGVSPPPAVGQNGASVNATASASNGPSMSMIMYDRGLAPPPVAGDPSTAVIKESRKNRKGHLSKPFVVDDVPTDVNPNPVLEPSTSTPPTVSTPPVVPTTTPAAPAVATAAYPHYPQFSYYLPQHYSMPAVAGSAATTSQNATASSSTSTTAPSASAAPKPGTFQPYSYVQYTGATSAPEATAVYTAVPYMAPQPYYGGPTPPQPPTTGQYYAYMPTASGTSGVPAYSYVPVTSASGQAAYTAAGVYQYYQPAAASAVVPKPTAPKLIAPKPPAPNAGIKRRRHHATPNEDEQVRKPPKISTTASPATSLEPTTPSTLSTASTVLITTNADTSTCTLAIPNTIVNPTSTPAIKPRHAQQTALPNGSSFGVLHLPLSKASSAVADSDKQSRWIDVDPSVTPPVRPVGRPRLHPIAVSPSPLSVGAAAAVSMMEGPTPAIEADVGADVTMDEVAQVEAPSASIKLCSSKSCARPLPNGGLCDKCRLRVKKRQLKTKQRFKVEPKRLASQMARPKIQTGKSEESERS